MKVVKFYKNGCVPCGSVASYLASNGVEDVENVNIFDDPDKAVDFGIMSVPVTILTDEGGNEVSRVIGFDADKLKALIEAYKQG